MQSNTDSIFLILSLSLPYCYYEKNPTSIFRQSLAVAMWKKVSDLVTQQLEPVPLQSVSLKGMCSNHILPWRLAVPSQPAFWRSTS